MLVRKFDAFLTLLVCIFAVSELAKASRTEYSRDMRQLVIGMYLDNRKKKAIARELNMPPSTVRYIIKKYEQHGMVGNLPRMGRPVLATDRLRRLVVRQVLADRRLSADTVADQLREFHALIVSPSTVRNILHDAKLNGRAARKKPRISKTNKKKRLEYAKTHVDWDEEVWRTVVFTDESKYNLHESDGRIYVWRRVGEEFKENCLVTTYKSGDKGFMVWGAIGWNGVGPLIFCTQNITAAYYIEILEEALPECMVALDLGENTKLLQDNAPAHKAKKTMAYLDEIGLPTLPHPPQSPDLNPIEHVWDYVGREVNKIDPQTRDELKIAIETAWYATPVDFVQNLILSMPRRLQAVIESKGGATKY